MDKKLLQALDNLSNSLEMIADALSSKEEATSSTGASLKQGDFGKQLQEINAGIKLIKKDTEQILKNQQTIIALSKEKKKDAIEETGTDKKKESAIKKGVTTIILIAVAVLAIGLALKLVGPVDVLSAIGLGLAMVAIGYAFAKVAEATKGFGYKEILMASLSMIAMATAITISSWIMSLIKPISITQALTAIFIGGVFSVVAFGMRKMLNAFKGVDGGQLVAASIFLPLILPAIALGIALASYAFSLVKPIGFAQAISAIFIGAIFAVVSYGMRNMLRAFKGMNTNDLIEASIFLPLILPAIALGIAGASYALTLVQPISLMQWFTSILIGALFVVLSFGIVNIVKDMSKVDWGDIPKVPVFFVTIAAAIMLSSHILQHTADIEWGMMLKIAALGILMAGLTIALTPSFKILGEMDVTNLLKGGLAILIVAGAIMASSHILALGNYDTYPGLGWVAGVGLSLLTFGAAAFALGFMVFGPQALIFLAGIAAVLSVAGTIVGVAGILSKGKYDNKGMLEWAKATSLLYLTFTPIIFALGAMGLAGSVLSFFGLDNPFETAKSMLIQIADTIVAVSDRLSKGTFKGGPTKEWAEGVSISMGAFMPVYGMLMKNAILSIFGSGGVGPDDFTKAILTVSDGIITAAERFSSANAVFSNPPPVEWAEGVGLAIGAFAPVYKVLSEQDGWFSDGPSPEDMSNAILTISSGIIIAAGFFAANKSKFDEGNYPSKKWGEGVGAALGAFTPVFEMLSGKSWYQGSKDVVNSMGYGILAITRAIISSGYLFSKSDPAWWSLETAPTKEWGEGVSGAIEAFSSVFTMMSEGSGWFTSGEDVINDMVSGITKITWAITKSSWILSKGKFEKSVSPEYVKALSGSVKEYIKLAKYIDKETSKSGIMDKLTGSLYSDPIAMVANGISKLSRAYDKLSTSIDKFGNALEKINMEKLNSLKNLQTDQLQGKLEKVTPKEESDEGSWWDKITNKASDWMMPQVSESKTKPAGPDLTDNTKFGKNGKTIPQQLDMLIDLLSSIDGSTNTIDEYIQDVTGGTIKNTEL